MLRQPDEDDGSGLVWISDTHCNLVMLETRLRGYYTTKKTSVDKNERRNELASYRWLLNRAFNLVQAFDLEAPGSVK